MLKTTPLHDRTGPLCASHAWRRWAGHVVASSYELSHEHEYHAIRAAAALFDVSPLKKYRIQGRDAGLLLDLLAPRKVRTAAVGQVLYTPWCDHQGKVIDDGTITRLAEDEFRLTAAEPQLRWLSILARGMDVRIEDQSEAIAALSLQGPQSRAILQSLGLGELRYFRLARVELAGIPVEITRTGYTGDLGYEIWLAADRAVALWDALMRAGSGYGITPAGMLALDMARVEAGLMLLDVDYVPANRALTAMQTSSPYELDLGWAVHLDKERFVGREALAAEAARPALWRFVGIELDYVDLEKLHAQAGIATRLPSAAWRMSVPLYAAGEQVGYATSGCWSPLLKRYIALAHVEGPWCRPGTELEMEVTVEHRRRRAAAAVVAKPFFDPERKRA